ncbi:MAG: hypothetical protein KAJ10_03210 [Thermodesulfovibrionia bacterium]|nr:hypothetical protein [Thermodesulfovibrionia bacterium]
MIYDAQLDTKELELKELFIELKDILTSKLGKEVSIRICVYSQSEAAKIKAFITMSGCQIKVDKKEGCYILHITGCPCCV